MSGRAPTTYRGRALHCTSKQTGSSLPSLILTSSPFNTKRMSSSTSKGRALHCASKQTGSSLPSLILTSSPFNTKRTSSSTSKRTSSYTHRGRALHCTSKQTGSSLQSLILTKLSLQYERKSSYNSQRTSPSLYFKTDGLLPSVAHSDEALPSIRAEELLQLTEDEPFTVLQNRRAPPFSRSF